MSLCGVILPSNSFSVCGCLREPLKCTYSSDETKSLPPKRPKSTSTLHLPRRPSWSAVQLHFFMSARLMAGVGWGSVETMPSKWGCVVAILRHRVGGGRGGAWALRETATHYHPPPSSLTHPAILTVLFVLHCCQCLLMRGAPAF